MQSNSCVYIMHRLNECILVYTQIHFPLCVCLFLYSYKIVDNKTKTSLIKHIENNVISLEDE